LALSRKSDESGKRDGKRWEEMGAKDDAGSEIEDRGLKDWWNKIQGDKS
jgi:hypothetical protein